MAGQTLWPRRLPYPSSSNIPSYKEKQETSGPLLREGRCVQKHFSSTWDRENWQNVKENETTSLSRSEACHHCLHLSLASALPLFVSTSQPSVGLQLRQSRWGGCRFLIKCSHHPHPQPPLFYDLKKKGPNHRFSHHHCANHWHFLLEADLLLLKHLSLLLHVINFALWALFQPVFFFARIPTYKI